MPQQFRLQSQGGVSRDRVYVALMDWCRRVMQLAGPASVLILAFLLYHLFFGIVPNWDANKDVVGGDAEAIIGGAVTWLNVVFVAFLLTLCILNWSESVLGLILAIAGVGLYFGVPLLFDFVAQNQIALWQSQHNIAALAIYNELRILGVICVVPGVILTVRDIVERCVDGTRTSTERRRAMQFGGAVLEEEPAGEPVIGVIAKCWQLPFCRIAIRGNCPIFLSRTRCWRHHVGCMCEENVIRLLLDPIVRNTEVGKTTATGGVGITFASGMAEGERAPWARGETEQRNAEEEAERRKPNGGRVRIPFNNTLSPAQKRERCRNCVIYNEHQRRKYQFFAPIAVLLCPALTYVYFAQITEWLQSAVQDVDAAMAKLLLDPAVREVGVMSSMPPFAQYVLIGCLVALGITATLRFLEYCVFKLKI